MTAVSPKARRVAAEPRRRQTSRRGVEARPRSTKHVAAMDGLSSPELKPLIEQLNRAIDPRGIFDQVRTLKVGLDIGGRFVDANQHGIFSAPGARAEVSLDQEKVTFFNVPAAGMRSEFLGDKVMIWDRNNTAKMITHVPEALREVGSDPRLILGMAADESGPLGAPLQVAREGVRAASAFANLATFGLFDGMRRAAHLKDPTKNVKVKKAELIYFFGYALRFYLRMTSMLKDPRTQVARIEPGDSIHREIPAKLGIGDSTKYIGLKVRWPGDTRTHSRDMDLFYDPKTKLLAFFRFDVDTLNPAFRAWYKTSDWQQDPATGLMAPGRRQALVSPGGAEIPGQPWTVNAHMGAMTATLK